MTREKAPSETQSLLAGLAETSRALRAARSGFDETADQDLLEYYLYEMSALGARHTYLLRQVKNLKQEDDT